METRLNSSLPTPALTSRPEIPTPSPIPAQTNPPRLPTPSPIPASTDRPRLPTPSPIPDETARPQLPTPSPISDESLPASPVRVEFTGPEETDLTALQVFDADGQLIEPVSDEETGEAIPGVYELMPGEYSYTLTVGEEGEEGEVGEDGEEAAPEAERVSFTVDAGQETLLIDLAHSEEESVPVAELSSPEPLPPQESAGPGLWGGVLIGLLSGLVLGCAALRAVQKLTRKKKISSSGSFRIQARAVQGLGARKDQQDSLYMSDGRLYDKQGILMCVADGMGGLSDGAKMSQAVVTAVEQGFATEEKEDPERLIFSVTRRALDAANQTISPNFGSSGSTMVLGYLRGGEFTFASVGDSRICLYRDGALWHLNRRHVYEDELKLNALNDGSIYESATLDKKKAALTSYLGMGKLKYTDLPDVRIPVRRGDRIILMSDGVFNTLSDEELIAILGRKIDTVTKAIAEQIKLKANRYQDNFTAIVVAVE